MKVRFLSLAEREMHDAFDWYEGQATRLGYELLNEIDQAISRIRRFPESCSSDAHGMRRVLLNRFPYCLWYAIETNTILVYAVAHLHREPRYWVDRLPEENL